MATNPPTANPDETRAAHVAALKQQLLSALDGQLQQLAETLTDMESQRPFGAIEFRLRDLGHQLIAAAQQVALDRDKKRGTKGPVASAPTAKPMPNS